MSSHAIRTIDPADYAALITLWHQSWHDAHAALVPKELVRLRSIKDFTDRLPRILLQGLTAGPVGEPLGFCTTRKDEIYQLFLSQKARSTGLAQEFMQDAETRMIKAGITHAFVECVPENSRAIRFYQSCGWKKSGIETVQLDTASGTFPLPTMILRKTLR